MYTGLYKNKLQMIESEHFKYRNVSQSQIM